MALAFMGFTGMIRMTDALWTIGAGVAGLSVIALLGDAAVICVQGFQSMETRWSTQSMLCYLKRNAVNAVILCKPYARRLLAVNQSIVARRVGKILSIV